MRTIRIYDVNNFVKEYCIDRVTAFQLDPCPETHEQKPCNYIVRKTPGVYVWELYAVSARGKEWFIGAYYSMPGYSTFDLISEPEVTRWYYRHWAMFNAFLQKDHPLQKHMLITRLGICKKCGKILTDKTSIMRGYGPDCFNHILDKLEGTGNEHMD